MHLTDPNPIHKLLRRQMGIDSFALDGDQEVLWETWEDQPRKKRSPPGHRPAP
ncbi:MAG: hypothetical protein ABR562_01135 [Thermoplasmatota archaeon]